LRWDAKNERASLSTAGPTLAKAAGINQEIVVDLISRTPAGQGHIRTVWPDKALVDDPAPAFMLDLAYKDAGLALEAAAGLKLPLTTGSAGRQIYAIATAQGHVREDWTTGTFRSFRILADLV
jgi:4-hydroxybutyrate dehydrogenase/sulfolactaldehyde 3-reductase